MRTKGLRQAWAGPAGGSSVLCSYQGIGYLEPHHCPKMVAWEGQRLSLGRWQGQLLEARGAD